MRDRVLAALDFLRLAVLALAGGGIVLHLDSQAADPLAPKTFWFAAGAGLLLGLSAARLWWGGRLELPPKRALACLAALAAAALLSFLSSNSRPLGEPAFNAWLLFLALLLCAYDLASGPERQRRLMFLAALPLLLAVLGGLRGGDPAFGARRPGSFGNPNFLAGFLVLAWPCAAWLAQGRLRPLALLSAAALALLMMTGSKAALLGLGFQYFALGHLGWHSDRPAEWRRGFLKYWALCGAAAALAAALALPALRQRVLEGFKPGHESVQFRLSTWEGAAAAWKAKLWTGHGPGSFAAVYPAHRPERAMASQVQHSYEVTHPENWPLQLLAETGILGLLAALAFIAVLGWPLWKKAHAWGGEGLADTWLVLALGGSLVCNLAALDLFLPSTAWTFAMLAALALRRAGGPALGIRLNADGFFAATVSLLILLFSLFPALQSMARWKASRELQQAKALSMAGRFAEALPAYESSLAGDPSSPEALYFHASALLDSGKSAQALARFEELQKLAPDYVLVHDKKARALLGLGRMDEASAEWERQLKLDPWYLPAVQQLSSLYASRGLVKEAVAVLEAAAPRFPDEAQIIRNLSLLRRKMGNP